MSFSRVILGSAQFAGGYGVANEQKKFNVNEIYEILDYALSIGINKIDTANAYENAESILGNFGANKFRIITKIPKKDKVSINYPEWMEEKLEESLSRLKTETIYCLHLHSPEDLLTPEGEDIILKLEEFKRNSSIKKIGFSVYNSKQLKSLLSVMTPDIVQVPVNVFDQRLIKDGSIGALSDRKIKIHIRSIFLQGLMLMEAKNRPDYFDNWKDLFNKWDQWNNHELRNKINSCLNFSMNLENISNIIIGVDSLQQLKNLYRHKIINDFLLPDYLCTEDEDLLDPRRWQI